MVWNGERVEKTELKGNIRAKERKDRDGDKVRASKTSLPRPCPCHGGSALRSPKLAFPVYLHSTLSLRPTPSPHLVPIAAIAPCLVTF